MIGDEEVIATSDPLPLTKLREWESKDAQDLMMYYGADVQLAYVCGSNPSPMPFNITAQSITGLCVTFGEDGWLYVTVAKIDSIATGAFSHIGSKSKHPHIPLPITTTNLSINRCLLFVKRCCI